MRCVVYNVVFYTLLCLCVCVSGLHSSHGEHGVWMVSGFLLHQLLPHLHQRLSGMNEHTHSLSHTKLCETVFQFVFNVCGYRRSTWERRQTFRAVICMTPPILVQHGSLERPRPYWLDPSKHTRTHKDPACPLNKPPTHTPTHTTLKIYSTRSIKLSNRSRVQFRQQQFLRINMSNCGSPHVVPSPLFRPCGSVPWFVSLGQLFLKTVK